MATAPNDGGFSMPSESQEFRFSSDISLEDLRNRQHQSSYPGSNDLPGDTLLAMVGNVGDLAKIFQQKGQVGIGLPEFSPNERVCIGEKISDLLLHVVELAAQCHVDLPASVYHRIGRRTHPPRGADGGTASRRIDHQEGTVPPRRREEGDGSEE